MEAQFWPFDKLFERSRVTDALELRSAIVSIPGKPPCKPYRHSKGDRDFKVARATEAEILLVFLIHSME